MNKIRVNKRKKGSIYEKLALDYLLLRGFTLVEKNFCTRVGEIDIIMSKDEVLHFIEVKASKSFDPLLNITEKKMQRLINCGDIFLSKNDLEELECKYFCFSAIGFRAGLSEIIFIENITM